MTPHDPHRQRGALLIGALLSALALGAGVAPATAQSPTRAIEYSIWGDPAELASQQAVVNGFMAKHPDITVHVTVSDWDTYWDKLQTGLAGGDAPDVFAMDGPLYPDYQSRGALMDLSPYITRDNFDLTALADAGVADFTTPDGQFGLPRDLNVVALYYNKDMFDAAGLAYPDATWTWDTLVEAGKKLTLDTNGDGQTDQWGFYTETTDMENYWSSLVWQNGGDIVSADHTKTLLGSAQAIGGIQQLQDLIYTHKIMPPPQVSLGLGDAFEQKQAAMEANGSWLVPTHLAAGINLGIAPLPAGPAGAATSINPTGVVVANTTKEPDAAWEFVKYMVGPEAQTQLMQLKSAVPVDKSVLAGPYSTAFPGSDVFASVIVDAHLKPSFRGFSDWSTALQEELDVNVFNDPLKTAQQAMESVVPTLDGILAQQAP